MRTDFSLFLLLQIRDLHVHSMDRTNLVYLEPPNVKWVNPSDCVDMDCDGHKEILIEDIDGSLTGSVGGSVISKAEYEWNGDPRRGLGTTSLIIKQTISLIIIQTAFIIDCECLECQ